MEFTASNVFSLVLILLIIGSIIAAYFYLSNTPLGRALAKLFGAVAGTLGKIADDADTCNDVGWFNVGKGCWLGALGVGIAGVWLIFSGLSLFARFRYSGLLESALKKAVQLEPNKSSNDIIAETVRDAKINDVLKSAESKNFTSDQLDAAIETAITRRLNSRIADSIRNSGSSQIQEELQAQQAEYNTVTTDINDGLTEAESSAVDDAVTESGVDIPDFGE